MKYRLLLILIPSLLLGCGQNKTTVITNSPPVAPEQSQENQDKTIIEYLWLSTGPDFTEARLTELAATWNDLIDAGAYEVITANILRPQFESENFDLIWVLLWSSDVARDKAWAHWNRHQSEDWQQQVDGVLTFEPSNSFLYEPLWGYKSPALNLVAGDTFFSTFNFCTLAKSQNFNELQAFKTRYNRWLSESHSAAEYGYLTLKARFELKDVDFVWLDIFANEETRNVSAESWSGTGVERAWNAMTSCENFEFSSIKIRS